MQALKSKGFLDRPRVSFLPVGALRPNPSQPRKVFDQDGLRELADSITQYGILQPLTVRRKPDGFELVAGERRLRAARLAGLKEVPCILLSVGEEESGMLALVENLQRRDLDFIEEAEGLARLMRLYGLSQEQAAARIGKSQPAVANKLRLLRHSPRVLAAVRENGLSERHARALLKLPGEQSCLNAIAVIVEKGFNVAKTEQYIDCLLQPPPQPSQPARRKGLGQFVLRDVRVFLNSVDHNLDLIKNAGIRADKTQEETEEEIVVTIRIPKKAG